MRSARLGINRPFYSLISSVRRNKDCCLLDRPLQIRAVPKSDQLERYEWETQDAVSYSDPGRGSSP
jgi:hypothetical protein